jgi:hypothetical protein
MYSTKNKSKDTLKRLLLSTLQVLSSLIYEDKDTTLYFVNLIILELHFLNKLVHFNFQ